MKIKILPDTDDGYMLCTSPSNPVGARLAHGKLAMPEGPVRRLTMGQAAQMAAKWEAFLEQQEKLERK